MTHLNPSPVGSRWYSLAARGAQPTLALALALVTTACAVLPGVLDGRRACAPDSDGYLWLGREIVFHARFANPDGTPHANWPPVYPLLIGLAQAIATGLGVRGPAADACECRGTPPAVRLIVLIMQCGLFLWSVRSLYGLSLRAGIGHLRARAVATIYALSPLPVIYAGRVLSETMFVALILAGANRLFLGVQRRDAGDARWWHAAVGAGILFGLSALTRAALAPWILLWPLIWLLAAKRRAVVMVGGLSLLLAIAPWLIRNHQCFGVVALNPATGTVDYLGGLASSRDEYSAAVADARAKTAIPNAFIEGRVRAGVVARLIATHPWRFVGRAAESFPMLWAPPVTDLLKTAGLWRDSPGTLAELAHQGPAEAVRIGWDRLRVNAAESGQPGAVLWPVLIAVGLISVADLIVTVCGLAGLFILLIAPSDGRGARPVATGRRLPVWFPRPTRLTWVILGTLVLVLIIGPLGIYHPRFRVPLSPALAFLAEPLISAGWRGVSARGRPRGGS